ncbi:MAG: ATP-binding domain-containing protein [Gammaproteobacteria bacterium]
MGEKANHTHENLGFRALVDRMAAHWGGTEETAFVIGNALWSNSEIDVVCLLPQAVAVIDLKDYGGRVKITENGPWRTDSGVVKGGSKKNPFVQVRDNKRAVMNWLEGHALLSHCNLGHISGGVVFTKPMEVEGDLGHKVNTWFRTLDLDRCTDWLAVLASPEIRLSPDDMQRIVADLGVTEYRYRTIQASPAPRSPEDRLASDRIEFTEPQKEALDAITRHVDQHLSFAFSVCGMTHTGKTTLLKEALAHRLSGRQAIVLTPNRRIAARLQESDGINAESIYSHIYDPSKPRKVSEQQSGQERKRTVTEFPIRDCSDATDAVYLFDEAQLLGNDYFEFEYGKRFGSGKLWDDFCEFIDAKNSGRQVILFGDPFQLFRGGSEKMPLFGSLHTARGLGHAAIDLIEFFSISERSALLRNTQFLADAIGKQDFTRLSLETDSSLVVKSKSEAASEAQGLFEAQMPDIRLATYSHAKAFAFTKWLRSELFGESSGSLYCVGDCLEVYHAGASPDSAFGEEGQSLRSGDVVRVVRQSAEAVMHSQSLKGREEPIRFTLTPVELWCGGASQVFNVFDEFLLSEKPDLDADTVVALEVWKKSSANGTSESSKESDVHEAGQPHYDNIRPDFIKARYAYAATAHHLQGHNFSTCIVNADCGDLDRRSESYFRWLYTALTRATKKCIVVGFDRMDSLSTSHFRRGDATLAQTNEIPLGEGWSPTPRRGDGEQSSPFSGHKDIGSLIRDGIASIAGGLGWHMVSLASHQYQEQVRFTKSAPSSQELSLAIYYNGKGAITKLLDRSGGGDDMLNDLAAALAKDALKDRHGERIASDLRTLLQSTGCRIIGAQRQGEHRLVFDIAQSHKGKCRLEVNHDKDGIANSIRLLKYSEKSLAQELERIFSGEA